MEHHQLSSENVRRIGMDCLFTDAEMSDCANPPENAVLVDGIVGGYAFHPERLAKNKPQIAAMLAGLPDDFMTSGGGGMSFLNACIDRDGNHWAEHPTMGLLFALGVGTGLATYIFPRKMWSVLPGGVPYLSVNSDAIASARSDA